MNATRHFFTYRFAAMGSPCEIQGFVADRGQGEAVAAAVEQDVLRLERRYSRYRDDSLLAQINRIAAAGGAIDVDVETAGLFDYAQTCHAQSGGLFDVTSGVLRRAWRFEKGELPDPELIARLLDTVGWEKLEWRRPRLAFPLAGMEIDLGGVVKEYAADRAATICTSAGMPHGVINLGGDIRVVGPRPDGSPWIIGIQHPRRNHAVLCRIEVYQGGVATSGDYERCILVAGERYSHILDPRTGWPVRHLAAVSVVGDFCLIAGSASTIGMLKEADGPEWLRQLGLPHLWMDAAGAAGGNLPTCVDGNGLGAQPSSPPDAGAGT